jgi:hypothetical protein
MATTTVSAPFSSDEPLGCYAGPASTADASAASAVSGRMSMRQPVSRAARRAFWPSLPMASDSW